MLREIDENRPSGAKPNSVKVRFFREATIDDMKDFLKPYLKRSRTIIILNMVQVIVSTIHQVSL